MYTQTPSGGSEPSTALSCSIRFALAAPLHVICMTPTADRLNAIAARKRPSVTTWLVVAVTPARYSTGRTGLGARHRSSTLLLVTDRPRLRSASVNACFCARSAPKSRADGNGFKAVQALATRPRGRCPDVLYKPVCRAQIEHADGIVIGSRLEDGRPRRGVCRYDRLVARLDPRRKGEMATSALVLHSAEPDCRPLPTPVRLRQLTILVRPNNDRRRGSQPITRRSIRRICPRVTGTSSFQSSDPRSSSRAARHTRRLSVTHGMNKVSIGENEVFQAMRGAWG